jgi:hypothetical protein
LFTDLISIYIPNPLRFDREQPTSIAAIRPYVPPSPPNVPQPSILQQLVDPLREFWFVRPPEGTEPGQLQGRPTNVRFSSTGVQDTAEPEINLTDAEEVSVALVIVMPNPERPVASEESNGSFGNGRPLHRPTTPVRPTGTVGIASTSTPWRDAADVGEVETSHQRDLPELIMGTVRIGIYKQEEPSVRDAKETDGS